MIEYIALLYAGGKVLKKVEEIKSVQADLDEDTKQKIFKEGIYHITTKENAEMIVKKGFIAPTRGVLNNHFSKSRDGTHYADYVYMFAGRPDKFLLTKNLSHMMRNNDDGTFYAVKHVPNKFEIENYTKRLQDGVITYEGKLDVENSNPEIVRLKVEKGKVIEIPLDAELKRLSRPEKIIRSIIRKGKSVASTAKELKQATMFYFDKNKKSKLRECKANRKLENRLLNQYSLEKSEKTFEIESKDKIYIISTRRDKFVDGRILSEFELFDTSNNLTKKVYTDRVDTSSISEDKLKEFFSKKIDFSLAVNQYIGFPRVREGKVVQEIDEDFLKHFSEKQNLKKKTDLLYSEMLENKKSEKQLKLFEMIYKKTPPISRRQAIETIDNIKRKGKQLGNSVKEFIKSEDGEIQI